MGHGIQFRRETARGVHRCALGSEAETLPEPELAYTARHGHHSQTEENDCLCSKESCRTEKPPITTRYIMNTTTVRFSVARIRCYWRPIIFATAGSILVGVFWFASRYPQLARKASHVGDAMPSMAYSSQILTESPDAPVWQLILASSVNWLDNMKIGMTFGVLFGALLHTVLRYYPLKIGKNLYLNSLKGALVGIPMGVCANCAVPTACGVTRGRGRLEVALGFLFSSPNLNPVVVMLTFTALPLAMGLTKYAVLMLLILILVPSLIRWLERETPLQIQLAGDGETCALKLPAPDECQEEFAAVSREMATAFARHVWMLLKPTVTIMLLSSILSAVLLTVLPWATLLSEITLTKLTLVSLIAVFMPVPIALDVMFAAQLHQQGMPSGYVMLFAMTLGTYSIIPMIYLWREVSKRLAAILFVFFVCLGWVLGLVF
jgi:uncharacterized membrane protein YraQ (UPF0718 family)